MSLFHRKKRVPSSSVLVAAERQQQRDFSLLQQDETAQQLYRQLRYAVPIIDAALSKIVRLTGSYTVAASDQTVQKQLDTFVQKVPCDSSGQSLQSFTDRFLDSLLTCGNALGEILVDSRSHCITGLHCAEWFFGAASLTASGTAAVQCFASAGRKDLWRICFTWDAGTLQHSAANL